jgi:hypothetical protein
MAGGLAELSTDQTIQQTAITRSIVVPHVASITGDEERADEVSRLEKTFGKELTEWVNIARRSIA